MGLGLSELFLLAFFGILFLKPAELRKLAKTVGRWMAEMRRMSQEFTSELSREVDLSEIRKVKQDLERGIRREIDAVMNEPELKPNGAAAKNPFTRTSSEDAVSSPVEHVVSDEMAGEPRGALPSEAISETEPARLRETNESSAI